MKISELLSENNTAAQISANTQAMGQAFQSGQMAPKQFAPGEISLSQIFSHPKFRETVQAMHKKYPSNRDQAQRAAEEVIKGLIRSGK